MGALLRQGFFMPVACAWRVVTPCQGECGSAAPCPFTLTQSHKRPMRALDRIKSAVSMVPQRKAVTLPDGSEFEWWMAPLTLAQRAKAQKLAGSDDAIAFALRLLVMVARDENGQPLFVSAELAELRNAIPAKVVDDMLLVMLDAKKDEAADEEEEFDPKPSAQPSAKKAG